MLRSARTVRNVAEARQFYLKYKMEEYPLNFAWKKGGWACQQTSYWQNVLFKEHIFFRMFDDNGKVKSYQRMTSTEFLGREFRSGEVSD